MHDGGRWVPGTVVYEDASNGDENTLIWPEGQEKTLSRPETYSFHKILSYKFDKGDILLRNGMYKS